MNDLHKEAKYRLGDLYNNKISANMDSYFAIKNKKTIQHNLGKQWTRGIGPSIRKLSKLTSEDIYIPVAKDDKASSENGYVFSFARSNGDNRVGLLDDHWLYKNEIVNEDELRLHREHKFYLKYSECVKKNLPMPHGYFKKFLETHPEFEAIDKLDMETVKNILIPKKTFKEKLPLLFWRGATTGGWNDFQIKRGYAGKAVERKDIIQYFEKHPHKNIDILFSTKKPKALTLMETLQEANVNHKYLIDLQGNDVASNTYWIYKKNCIVFRADFLKSYNAWDLYLEPWVHYVPFSHENYSDLVEKIKWCEKNTSKCEKIIKAANNLHSLMMDNNRKEKVYSIMLNKIRKNLDIS